MEEDPKTPTDAVTALPSAVSDDIDEPIGSTTNPRVGVVAHAEGAAIVHPSTLLTMEPSSSGIEAPRVSGPPESTKHTLPLGKSKSLWAPRRATALMNQSLGPIRHLLVQKFASEPIAKSNSTDRKSVKLYRPSFLIHQLLLDEEIITSLSLGDRHVAFQNADGDIEAVNLNGVIEKKDSIADHNTSSGNTNNRLTVLPTPTISAGTDSNDFFFSTFRFLTIFSSVF